jgi:hypothetical protein
LNDSNRRQLVDREIAIASGLLDCLAAVPLKRKPSSALTPLNAYSKSIHGVGVTTRVLISQCQIHDVIAFDKYLVSINEFK